MTTRTKPFLTRRSVLALAGTTALVPACGSGAAWHSFVRDPSFAPQKKLRLVVFRSKRAQALDDAGFIDTTVLTVQEDLRERGIEGEIVDGRAESYAPPRAELFFTDVNEGNGGERWMFSGLAGAAGIDVECRFFDPNGKVVLSGRVRGEDHGEYSSGRGAAEAAGHALADAFSDPKYKAPVPHFQKSGPSAP